jgi:hypothetical protein
VAGHHRAEGAGRLTPRRIDRACDQLQPRDLGVLTGLLDLPFAAGGLRDVIPAGPGQLTRAAYPAQVLDIAPDIATSFAG